MRSFELGKSGEITIFFKVEHDFGVENAVVITNSLKNGKMIGEPIIAPEEYFYQLFGEEVKEYFKDISSRRLDDFSISKPRKEKREFSSCFDDKIFCKNGNSIIFKFWAGSTHGLTLTAEIKEKSLVFLKNEEEVRRQELQRALETAAYGSGHGMSGLSLL